MKWNLFFLVLLIGSVPTVLSAQQEFSKSSDAYSTSTHYYQGNELWINDTICYYSGDGISWAPNKRMVIQSRDGIGQELESSLEFFDELSSTWKPSIKNVKVYYYFSGATFLKESKTLAYNPLTNKWIEIALNSFDKSGKMTSSLALDWDDENYSVLGGTKEDFTYDKNGNQIMTVLSFWNNYGQNWDKNYRISNYPNNESGTIVENTEKWNADGKNWVLANSKVESKDQAGNPITLSILNYDENGKKVTNQTDKSFLYNEHGDLIEITEISNSATTKRGEKELHLYRNDGKLVKKINLVLDQNTTIWFPQNEVKFIYEKNSLSYTTLTRVWNKESEQWSNKLQETHNYKGTELTNKVIQKWDSNSSLWVNMESHDYKYLGSELRKQIYKIWDVDKSEWSNQSRRTFEYNSFGKSSESYFTWNDTNNDWLHNKVNTWIYDESGNIVGYEELNGDDSSWEFGKKVTFGWHMFALSKTESWENYTIEVFPNPTKGVLHIKSVAGSLSRIAILDQYGQMLEATSLDQQSTTIDISHLPSGNYFIECNSGAKKNTFKVVKL